MTKKLWSLPTNAEPLSAGTSALKSFGLLANIDSAMSQASRIASEGVLG